MQQTQPADTGRLPGEPTIVVTGRPGGSLPNPATVLIGQDHCLSGLEHGTADRRLVTITGSGVSAGRDWRWKSRGYFPGASES